VSIPQLILGHYSCGNIQKNMETFDIVHHHTKGKIASAWFEGCFATAALTNASYTKPPQKEDKKKSPVPLCHCLIDQHPIFLVQR
jgi:hypothetical protein